jgi:hypothetical protein
MGEFVHTRAIAEGMAFFASPAASMVTGQELVVDGGARLEHALGCELRGSAGELYRGLIRAGLRWSAPSLVSGDEAHDDTAALARQMRGLAVTVIDGVPPTDATRASDAGGKGLV